MAAMFVERPERHRCSLPSVSVHLAKRLQRIRFLEIDQPETRIVCGGRVLTDRDEMDDFQ